MTNDNILLLGGTGFVGRSVCEQLVERSGGGAQVVVPSRRSANAKHLMPLPTVRVAPADVHDEAQLTALVRGCDAVINLVAILHVSALGVGPAAPSRYLRSKTAGEAVLAAAGMDLTILRPSVIFGEHDRFLNLFARLQAVFPVLPLAAAQARFQPVWVHDVAAAIVHCLDDATTIGRIFECTGPQAYTLKELAQAAGRWSGHPRPVIGLPDALGRVQALAMAWLPGAPLMSRDNLDSMRVPNVATGRLPGLQALGITPATLGSVAPDYLGAGRGSARLNRWRAWHSD